ncbi:YceD family protein [Lentzea sp.]|uniref:YceD family protein n=1 Tax=Lentzea sp. TaxID=56099 RepID=UPI002D15FC21|nr:YceD family protein [Lentzea sp.]HUQ61035.1 YceD family protein [Lentzea sp.]
MTEHRHASTRPTASGPWVIDTRDIGRRAGSSRPFVRSVPAAGVGLLGVIAVPESGEVELDLLIESVVEGVLVSGTAFAKVEGECARCLEPISDEVEVRITELYAWPDSTTDETTDEDEVSRIENDLIDLEPVVRDAIVLALPQAPLCEPDCKGLCPECGGRWAELGPDHGHETIDPRWAALQERFSDDNNEEK